jgi:hypothetical protein
MPKRIKGKQKGGDKVVGCKRSDQLSTLPRPCEKKMPANYKQLFPFRLHYLLDMFEQDGIEDICSFQPHGKAFLVHDQNRFVKELLPM